MVLRIALSNEDAAPAAKLRDLVGQLEGHAAASHGQRSIFATWDADNDIMPWVSVPDAAERPLNHARRLDHHPLRC